MWLVAIPIFITVAYHLAATVAALLHVLRGKPEIDFYPPVSILKPVHGLDPRFEEAVLSHIAQDYPGKFEILFGFNDPFDPAIAVVDRLAQTHPNVPIRIVPVLRKALNAKVGSLTELAAAAQYEHLLVNDGDIVVERDYLRQTVPALADPAVGIVTCLYRAAARSVPARWEAFGIAVDFMPSVLVAPLVGIREFGLGATLVFRARDLERIGGFPAIEDYIADDYQLAKRITALGMRSELATTVVETELGDDTWAGVWSHQVRWARTIRVSRRAGYLGLPATHAGVWILLALLTGHPMLALAAAGARWLAALVAGVLVLRSPIALGGLLLAPLWDLWAFVIWIQGLTGRRVQWRNVTLELEAGGRIVSRR